MLSTDTSPITVSGESDPEVCRKLWDQLIPQDRTADLWDVRACFHKNFARELLFIVARENGKIVGFLPTAYIEEDGYYGYFPGEVWNGKTWLEQNRIICQSPAILKQMLAWFDDNEISYHLRYLTDDNGHLSGIATEDEIGYLFYPETCDYSMDGYYESFSHRSIKSILKEIDRMYQRNVEICEGRIEDFEAMVALNIERYGTQSYFANNQFVKSFRELRDFLHKQGYLRITTVNMDGCIAAVDMGCLYNGEYILLAGGTHGDFRGVAKMINLYHIRKACEGRFRSADFLCGDFSWKTLFHLTPRPLYQITNIQPKEGK